MFYLIVVISLLGVILVGIGAWLWLVATMFTTEWVADNEDA